MQKNEVGETISIFVKGYDMMIFEGISWPGLSVWVDFLNEGGRNYWKGLYQYDKFKGTNSLYQIWIDMNEPSVS